MKTMVKTVQMTMEQGLLERLDEMVRLVGSSRSDFIRIAVQHEIKRHENERLEREHRASFENDPQSAEETWTPATRAWGDD
jgi:metal-responsive CopG/Arc/MetJ family transcriptional regulator